MKLAAQLKVRIFADGADLDTIRTLSARKNIAGFTTNPTLMRKVGITNYEAFARDLLRIVPDRPVSFEVFADDFDEIEDQARIISSWGPNVFVKIPVTTTRGAFCGPVIRRLSADGVALNVTAVMTVGQVRAITECLDEATPAVVSVFAGRIADTGRDPIPLMAESLGVLRPRRKAQLLWASPRELLNIVQADELGCHIVTVTNDLLAKLELLGKDLEAFSLETVCMFHRDATAAGYQIDTGARARAVG